MEFILLRQKLEYKGERMFNERKEADRCTKEKKEEKRKSASKCRGNSILEELEINIPKWEC